METSLPEQLKTILERIKTVPTSSVALVVAKLDAVIAAIEELDRVVLAEVVPTQEEQERVNEYFKCDELYNKAVAFASILSNL